ncbi:DUF3179 domain-containing protein [Candidatus Uhrbacteria bacterium]|nr:DUF3179 domain-containing protein [Candidatus Uhrbacteria bacterium]
MSKSTRFFVALGIGGIFIAIVLFVYREKVFLPQDAVLPSGIVIEPRINRESAPVSNDDAVIGEKDGLPFPVSTRAITITDGVTHSVPLEQIVAGGPPRDGIPPIDSPKFIPAADGGKNLRDDEAGIALSYEGVDRFYPFEILVFHEIVNDTINGKRVLVTYCPLCYSGIVFDPLVNGERVEFGTSGKLWNSNLVMYDRKTESLWPQVLGEAVVGEMTGTRLSVIPSNVVRFGDWSRAHPRGEVLSRETGAFRSYGHDPYGDYYTTPGVYFPVANKDDRLGEKASVLGLVFGGQAKAYPVALLRERGTIQDTFAKHTIEGEYDAVSGEMSLYEIETDGKRKRLAPFFSYWFSWAAAWPQTDLYQ